MHMKLQLKVQQFLSLCAILFFSFVSVNRASAANVAGPHPYYLHALSDLRAARWMIEHRPGNWVQTQDEIAAVHRIDAAIGEIKKASIEDGKNLQDHPHVDEAVIIPALCNQAWVY